MDRRSGSIPERTRDTISKSDAGALQESGSPGPGRNDGGGNESRFDSSASSAEHFRGLQFIVVAFENPGGENLLQCQFEVDGGPKR